jgi:rhodanese-related sulfurtransferase
MRYRILLSALLFQTILLNAQYKDDNVLYKTVDPADLCAALDANKGYLLLDVRSKAEHDDTSSNSSLNIGHFKGAHNITINELGSRLKEISDYKNKPVFVYCSHSQRSRRASKMLADSGFTKVFNVNGGMTAFHYMSVKNDGCLNSLYETSNNYRIISFDEICERKKKGDPLVIDVRSDSAWKHISRDPKINAMGFIKGSVNIPLTSFQDNTAQLPSKDKEIIIADLFGGDAARVAKSLTENGYKNVSVLIEGVDRIIVSDHKTLKCPEMFQSNLPYKTFNALEFGRYMQSKPTAVLIDLRTKEEFNNSFKDSWRNIGHLKNAINIPFDELASSLSALDKNKEIIVYAFSNNQEIYKAANLLTENGFTNIRVLTNGIFNVRWSAANVKGQAYLKEFVVDVPDINL